MANKRVFREYIGAQGKGVHFHNVPINAGVEFHFILSFAIDYSNTPGAKPSPTNGVFTEFWDKGRLTPDAVKAVKANPDTDVRVMLSIGGADVGGRGDCPARFDPTGSKVSWIENAFKSLKDLITRYHLDGVDINYESFSNNVDPDRFAACIGELLCKLRAACPGLITSIAPYRDTERYYRALWDVHHQHIDYVNYQFYAFGKHTTRQQYLQYYREQVANYNGAKLLAAINTTNPGVLAHVVPRDEALEACRVLNQSRELRGIFIWSADSSFVEGNNGNLQPFQYEVAAQDMLAT